jgi:hypothetical protein
MMRPKARCVDACDSGNIYSMYVDLYNASSNIWVRFPQGLGQARCNLAAASLSSGLVFFAGGESTAGASNYEVYVVLHFEIVVFV